MYGEVIDFGTVAGTESVVLNITDWAKETGREDPVHDILLTEEIPLTDEVEIRYEYREADPSELFIGQDVVVKKDEADESVVAIVLQEEPTDELLEFPEEVEAIRVTGPMMRVSDGREYTEVEVELTDEGVIELFKDRMRDAEYKEGPVPAIGPSVSLLFEGADGMNKNYDFFFDGETVGFDAPGDADGRYYLDSGATREMREILYQALEEETDQKAGVQITASPMTLPEGETVLSLTVENLRAAGFLAQEIRFEKRTEDEKWAPFPSAAAEYPPGTLVCHERVCEWELLLKTVADEWPAGEYRAVIETIEVPFFVE
ncbi:hypothetical protein [Indiicoccus explosivorum]|uniref:hypothetical protein n=1 Tax=Indiicoccus explosivorum TaxID=1917864 RepID=UPI000B43C26B|nr:hypothetical protein [Indiicoccus explosivorum]